MITKYTSKLKALLVLMCLIGGITVLASNGKPIEDENKKDFEEFEDVLDPLMMTGTNALANNDKPIEDENKKDFEEFEDVLDPLMMA